MLYQLHVYAWIDWKLHARNNLFFASIKIKSNVVDLSLLRAPYRKDAAATILWGGGSRRGDAHATSCVRKDWAPKTIDEYRAKVAKKQDWITILQGTEHR